MIHSRYDDGEDDPGARADEPAEETDGDALDQELGCDVTPGGYRLFSVISIVFNSIVGHPWKREGVASGPYIRKEVKDG